MEEVLEDGGDADVHGRVGGPGRLGAVERRVCTEFAVLRGVHESGAGGGHWREGELAGEPPGYVVGRGEQVHGGRFHIREHMVAGHRSAIRLGAAPLGRKHIYVR